MKFVKILEHRGHPVYVQADCPQKHSIAYDLEEALKAKRKEDAKNSVPPKYRPDQDFGGVFDTFFGKKH